MSHTETQSLSRKQTLTGRQKELRFMLQRASLIVDSRVDTECRQDFARVYSGDSAGYDEAYEQFKIGYIEALANSDRFDWEPLAKSIGTHPEVLRRSIRQGYLSAGLAARLEIKYGADLLNHEVLTRKGD